MHAVERLLLPAKRYWYPRFSPDGGSLAIDIGSGQGSDDEIWRYDLRSRALSRVTFDPGSALPAESTDGLWIEYTGGSGDRVRSIFRKRVDGGCAEELAWRGNDVITVSAWLPGDRSLLDDDRVGELGLFHRSLDQQERRRVFAAPGGQWGSSLRPGG